MWGAIRLEGKDRRDTAVRRARRPYWAGILRIARTLPEKMPPKRLIQERPGPRHGDPGRFIAGLQRPARNYLPLLPPVAP